MKIIFNHTVRSIFDNIGQFFVVLLTVTVLTALFFATLTLGDLFYNLQYSMASRACGDCEIALTGDIFSEEELLSFTEERNDILYLDRYLDMTGLLRTSAQTTDEQVVLIETTDLSEFFDRHSEKLYRTDGITADTQYAYPEIWMTKSVADSHGWHVGDEVELYISLYEDYQHFTVTYLFEEKGIFANSSVNNVLIDFSAVGNRGLLNAVYVKLTDEADSAVFKRDFTERFGTAITASDAVDYEYIENLVKDNESLLTVMMFFIVALVLFILGTTYGVLFRKRTSEMLIFKAAGATAAQTVLMLLFEGLLYGIFGAVFGTVLGRLGMQIVTMEVIPNFPDAIRYSADTYIYAVLLGVGISVVSASVPAVILTGNTVRRSAEKERSEKVLWALLPLLVGFAAAVAVIVLYPTLLTAMSFVLVVLIAGIIYVIAPYILRWIARIFRHGTGAKRVAPAIGRNRHSIGLTAMIGAVVAFSFIAVSIVSVVIDAIRPYNAHFSADYFVETVSDATDMQEVDQSLSSVRGINGSYLFTYDDKKTADGTVEYTVYTVEDATALGLVTEGVDDRQAEVLFSVENSVVITYDMANRFGLDIGDVFCVDCGAGTKDYTVCGIDTTATKNDRLIFIPSSSGIVLKKSVILLITDKNIPNADLYRELNEDNGILKSKLCYILDYEDWYSATNVGIRGIEILLRILQTVIAAVALIGIVNMTVSMTLGRKKEFDVYLSAGMDTKRRNALLAAEGTVLALSGGSIGLLFGAVINLLLPELGKLIDRYNSLNLFPYELPVTVATVAAVYIVIYFFIGKKTVKTKRQHPKDAI